MDVVPSWHLLVESSLRTTARPKIGAQGLWHCLGHSWPTRSIKKRGRKWDKATDSLRCCLGREERAGRRGRAQKGQACIKWPQLKLTRAVWGTFFTHEFLEAQRAQRKQNFTVFSSLSMVIILSWKVKFLWKIYCPDSLWESREDQEGQVKAGPGRNYWVSMGPPQLSSLQRLKMC